jgi:hypothetical protein
LLTPPLLLREDVARDAVPFGERAGLRAVVRAVLDRVERFFARPFDPEPDAACELRAAAAVERFRGAFVPLALELLLLLDPDLEERCVEPAMWEPPMVGCSGVTRAATAAHRSVALCAAVFLSVVGIDLGLLAGLL